MKNWKEGIHPKQIRDKRQVTLRLLVALMATLGVDIKKLMENFNGPKGRQYAEALVQALDENIKTEYEKGVKELTK